MKKKTILCNILFWITIISPPLSFSLSGIIGEVNLFGVAGIVRYSWIMILFIPVGVLSIFAGKYLKHNHQKYKKNYIAAFICIPILALFGSYRFIFNNISYDKDNLVSVENAININFPNKIKIATYSFDQYTLSYAKILDQKEKANFENELVFDEKWSSELNNSLKCLLPFNLQMEIEANVFDYFIFYNVATNDYNTTLAYGEYECIFVAYDKENGKLLLLNEYSVNPM